jgi:hypothetical protein
MARRRGVQLRLLARLRVELVQLGHGMAQEFLFAARPASSRLGLGQRRARLAPRGPCGAQGPRSSPGEGIQQHCRWPRGFKSPRSSCWPCSSTSVSDSAPQHLARGAAVVDPAGLAPVGH